MSVPWISTLDAAVHGQVFTQVSTEKLTLGFYGLSLMINLGVTLLVGMILVTFRSSYTQLLHARIRDQSERAVLFGVGVVVPAGIVLAALVLFTMRVPLLGLIVAVPIVLFLIGTIVVGNVVGIISVGQFAGDQMDQEGLMAALLLGTALVVPIQSIPYFGGILGLVMTVLGCGAMSIRYYEKNYA